MIKSILIVFSLISLNLSAKSIRSEFHNKMFSEEGLYQIMETTTYANNEITMGYKGVCNTMYADHCFLPTSKLSYFNSGVDMIEASISKNKTNVELRYMRLLVQLNAPGFLGYSSNINSDLAFFYSKISTYKISNYWKKRFVENLLAGEKLEDKDKFKLKKLYQKYAK